MELKGKTALVTGGARRVGRRIAIGLAEKGVNICLHYHTSGTDAKESQKEVESLGVQCRLVQADLEKSADILSMAAALGGGSKTVDILINNASLFYRTPVESLKESDWDRLLSVNLKAPFLLSRTIGVAMSQGKGGKIINIADWSGWKPYKDYAPYCTSKGGLITLTKALATDLAPKVMVNAIAPGPVLLPEDFTEEEKQKAVKKTLLGRSGTAEDVAYAVIFMLENDFINGTVLTVDGGRSINV